MVGCWKPKDGGLPHPMRKEAGWQRRLRSEEGEHLGGLKVGSKYGKLVHEDTLKAKSNGLRI